MNKMHSSRLWTQPPDRALRIASTRPGGLFFGIAADTASTPARANRLRCAGIEIARSHTEMKQPAGSPGCQ